MKNEARGGGGSNRKKAAASFYEDIDCNAFCSQQHIIKCLSGSMKSSIHYCYVCALTNTLCLQI